jgi:hypothetical protein
MCGTLDGRSTVHTDALFAPISSEHYFSMPHMALSPMSSSPCVALDSQCPFSAAAREVLSASQSQPPTMPIGNSHQVQTLVLANQLSPNLAGQQRSVLSDFQWHKPSPLACRSLTIVDGDESFSSLADYSCALYLRTDMLFSGAAHSSVSCRLTR